MAIGYGSLPWCNVGTSVDQSSSITFMIMLIIIIMIIMTMIFTYKNKR